MRYAESSSDACITTKDTKGEVYKCEICGNVVSVIEGGDGDLVCCGEEMTLLSTEEAREHL